MNERSVCLDMELDFDKYCLIDGRSPTTVLPDPLNGSKVSHRKTSCENGRSQLYELNCNQFNAVQGRDSPPERVDEVPKRGSIYVGSEERLQWCCTDAVVGSKNSFSETGASAFSFDSLCCSDEDIYRPKSENNGSRSSRSNLKMGCSSDRKMYDPLVNSSNQRSIRNNFDDMNAVPQCSPLHLRGLLKLRNKYGMPYEFTVKSLGDVYAANRKKLQNSLTWVYTIHSICRRRKGGIRRTATKSSTLGQVKVSCCSSTEFEGDGSLETHFVLYDMPQTRSLGPEHEIIAIVMQIPLEKRENLKIRCRDERSYEQHPPNLIDICQLQDSDISSSGQIQVAVPAGRHSLPISEKCSPSPLLDRLRYGGGCDCGGWDMACPLTVLSNPGFKIADNHPLISSQHSLQLYFQGRNDHVPAFSMRFIEDGKFEVDFHAFLSSLQAFSISIAVLHAAAASTFARERSGEIRMEQSECVKVHAEEVRDMICEGGGEETVEKKAEGLPAPPFSPMGRV